MQKPRSSEETESTGGTSSSSLLMSASSNSPACATLAAATVASPAIEQQREPDAEMSTQAGGGEAEAEGQREAEELKETSSSSPPAAGHKRGSTALADPSPSADGITLEPALKKVKEEASASSSSTGDADPAAASSTQPAAASASSSSSSRPQRQQLCPSFSRSVQILLEELPLLLQSFNAVFLSVRAPVEARVESNVREAQAELQLIQALDEAPALQQGLQPRAQWLKERIQANESWLASNTAAIQQEQTKLQEQLQAVDEATADLARAAAEGELRLSAGRMVHMLADGMRSLRWAHSKLLSNQLPPDTHTLQLRWTMHASSTLERLAAELTADEIRADPHIVSKCAEIGILSAVQRMLQLIGGACEIETTAGDPYLSLLAAVPSQHIISFAPLLHFIRYGLDPTLVSEQFPQSALQMARQHAEAHPLPLDEASSERAWVDSVAELADQSKCMWLPNLAIEHAAQHTAASPEEEAIRRAELHTRLMHALLSAWRAHSSAVRGLLLDLESTPDGLTPELVHVCAEYLDLQKADDSVLINLPD